MLKFILVLVLLEAYNTCYGDTSESDWRNLGFYRPRRNYSSQSQSPYAFGPRDAGYSQDSESQERVGTSFSHSQSSFGSASDNQSPQSKQSFGTGTSFGQKFLSQNSNYNQSSDKQNSFQTSHSQNYQNRNTFYGRNSGSLLQNAFNSNSQNRNSFGTDNSRNNQKENASGTSYSHNTQRQNTIGSSIGQNAFQLQNFKSNNLNINSSGSSFAFPRGQIIHKGPEYLPPNDTWYGAFGRYNLSGDNQMDDNNGQWPHKQGLKDEGLEHHQTDTAPDLGKISQNGNVASGKADQLENPFILNDQDSASDLHESGEPAEADKIEQDATLLSQTANPVLEPTKESNKRLSQAEPLQPASVKSPDECITVDNSTESTPPSPPLTMPDSTLRPATYPSTTTVTMRPPPIYTPPSYEYRPPSTRRTPPPPRPTAAGPAAGIGFMPVPIQEQFSAPLLQWYVGIYTKTESPYSQICGGSLVKTDVVLTAAHCFWEEDEALPAALYAAAAGKLQRVWNATSDASAQQSDIREIHIPLRFRGAKTNFQDDIAVARLSTPFEYAPGVKPVCVDFDLTLDREQLQTGSNGTIAGFGLTEENGRPSKVLIYQRLPYVEISDCFTVSNPGFLKYLTSDKICAGDQKSGIALCRGDSGGGLVFFTGEIDKAVIYLRGLASVAPRNNNDCNAHAIGSFTHVQQHMAFLREHIPGLEEECRTVYAEELGLGENKPDTKTVDDSKMNQVKNTEKQPATGEPQAKAKIMFRRLPINLSPPNDTSSEKGMQTSTDVVSNVDSQRKPKEPSVINVNPLERPVKSSVSSPNGANPKPNIGFISEQKVRGYPNTNIITYYNIFFTGPLVDPNKLYNQTNAATPVFVGGRSEQPINVYVFNQN